MDFKIINDKKKETPVQIVIRYWKELQEIPADNKAWDRVFYKRYARSAKDLVELMGDVEKAIECIKFLVEHFESSNLNYTLETIVKWSDYYRREGTKRGKKPDPYFGKLVD
jgi:hypothetical protein